MIYSDVTCKLKSRMPHFFWILILFTINSFAQKNNYIEVVEVSENGDCFIAASEVTTDGAFTKGYTIPVEKYDSKRFIGQLKAKEFKVDSSGIEYHKITIYDTIFSFVRDGCFSKNNLTIKRDSTKFRVTNKLNTSKEKKGNSSTYPFTRFTKVYHFPDRFIITNVNVASTEVKYDRFGNYVSFDGVNVNNVVYEIEYELRKREKNAVYKSEHELKFKRQNLKMEIWDYNVQDKDVFNFFIGDKVILRNFEAKNEKFVLDLPVQNGTKNKVTLTFENVSEGEIGPNTIKIRLYSENGYIDKTFDLIMTKKLSADINLIIED